MGGLRPIGSEKLQGMDKIRRIMEIARFNEVLPQSINENKSTEYMIQYMQDVCKVDNNCVMTYMRLSNEVKQQLIKEVKEFLEFLTLLD